MQVFISYAHTPQDKALAELLATALRAAQFEPWRDEEQLPPGQRLESDLSAAIERSIAGVFLISNSWLDSKFCRWELEQFGLRNRAAERDASGARRAARLVGILRRPHAELAPRLGPNIFDLTHLEWPDDGGSGDERFWKLYCGLKEQKPGPSTEWKARGAQISGGAFAGIKAVVAAPAIVLDNPPLVSCSQGPYGALSLTCDRHKHWGEIVTHARLARHEILAIVGPRKYGHRRLLARIAKELTDPPRVVKEVSWGGPQPQTQPDLLELVLRSIAERPASAGNVEGRLADALRTILRTRNLVLLFPPLLGQFSQSPLVELYTKTLPQLLGTETFAHHLKCVQPIEWLPAPALQRVFVTVASMFSEPREDDDREPAARHFLASLRTKASAAMPLTVLPVLDEVPEDELTAFFERLDLTPGQREALLRLVQEQGKTPDDMFDVIDQYYDEYRGRKL